MFLSSQRQRSKRHWREPNRCVRKPAPIKLSSGCSGPLARSLIPLPRRDVSRVVVASLSGQIKPTNRIRVKTQKKGRPWWLLSSASASASASAFCFCFLLLLLLLLSASAVVGWFWIDIISCLPISYMQSLGIIAKESNSPADKTKFFRILRLLRLTKLLRLARFKRMLEVSEPKTPIFLLFNSLFLLFSFSQFSFRWFYQDWLGTNVRKTNSTKKRLRLKKYKISVMRRTSRRSLQDSRSARRFC